MTNSVTNHRTFLPVPLRDLKVDEADWVSEILKGNPHWAAVSAEGLKVVAECSCGCRSIEFDESSCVRNAKVKSRQDVVGTLDIEICYDSKKDYVSVLLHHVLGKLSHLEVIWHNFPAPVPGRWTELNRTVRAGFP